MVAEPTDDATPEKKALPSRFHFRAWDRREGRMIANVQDSLFYSADLSDDAASRQVMSPQPALGFLSGNPDYVLMQSTGISDIRGREIFEGDVINDVHGEGFLVRFGECALVTEESELPAICFYHYVLLEPGLEPTPILISDHYDIEVIGNAYEDPELLNADEIAGFKA